MDKKFSNLFTNMIFLELSKLYKDIYYLDNIDFYIKDTNSIVLSIPFFINQINASAKLLPIIDKYNIQDITIVTVSISNTVYIGDIECEVLPFYEWAVGL